MFRKIIYIILLLNLQGFSQKNYYDAYTDIFVYDSELVWAVTFNGNIWKTTNAGLNWIVHNVNFDSVFSIHFTKPTDGWLLSSNKIHK